MLNDAFTKYVKLRRATGFKFVAGYYLLKSFVAFAEARGDVVVHVSTLLEWAALASSPLLRRRRLLEVRRFALMLHAEDPRHEVPAFAAMGRSSYVRRSPYIYTKDDISRLLQAAAQLRLRNSIRPVMYVTLFGLLAATGLRISEALALRCEDITDDGLIICNTKFRKSRLVPLHETTRRALDIYLLAREKHKIFNKSLFVSASGRTLTLSTVENTFLYLTSSIGLRQQERGRQNPRIHDFRHTFAVRSLEQCGYDRDEVANHIVALSTYMGHVHVRNTYWYLEATPILMKQIAEATEAMQGEVP